MALNRVGSYTTGNNWTGTTYTDNSASIPSGAVKAIVFVLGGYTSVNITSVTIDGQSTTFDAGSLDADGTNLYGAHVGLCENFGTGTKTIVWTADGDASEGMAGHILWYDTDCELIDVDTYYADNNNTSALTSTSATGDHVVISGCGYYSDAGGYSQDPNADQTDVIAKTTGSASNTYINHGLAEADTVGASTTDTGFQAYYTSSIAVSIREVTGGGGGTPPLMTLLGVG